ncbi:class I SAM-dependent methyltransferase [Flavobacterium sp. j3]|uniref:Class I SAM-dependent methyltransferase n=1 Tax=Flavobacterium aureirubrum TaxID=3133147 RepID=A0ABU9N716_9FLAO
MNKGQISNILRRLRLIYMADWAYYSIERCKNRKKNNSFKKNNPDVKLPNDYLMFESFQIDYTNYYEGGISTAKWLSEYFGKYIDLKDLKILDWGCGPGRVIRHLPEVIGNGCSYYGTDYNKQTIDWCAKNLPGISFNLNSLEAKLPYSDNFFDVIYGISIFTHLSEDLHYKWLNELQRILKPNGILLLTSQGDNFKTKLIRSEVLKFNNGELVIRDKVKEGYRMFSAFQPSGFMKNLFNDVQILEHYAEPIPKSGDWIPQDVWIVKKK